jgi:hypothetical protein
VRFRCWCRVASRRDHFLSPEGLQDARSGCGG